MTRDDALRLLLPASFLDFVRWAWPLISPDPLIWGRHLDALCQHLQAIRKGVGQNLLVNLPPRHSKSLVCTVLFPVWLWLTDPTERVITASYGMKLSTEHAQLSRRLIESDEFRRLFPHLVLSDDSNSKAFYANTAGGQRLAVSVGGATTGFNATVIIVDDLHNVRERESEAERRNAIDYYRLALSSRLVPGRRTCRIVLGQRVHEEDVSGYVLAHLDESWSCLVLPFEFQPDREQLPNALGFADWRMEPGELLWPEAFDERRVRQIKAEHRADFECLFNQDTTAAGGNLFRKEWFKYFTERDGRYWLGERNVKVSDTWKFATVDLAIGTEMSNDWTVCATWAVAGQNLLLVDLVRERLDGTRIVPRLKGLWDRHKPAFMAVEDVAFQRVVIDQLRQAGVAVRRYKPDGPKESRAIMAETICEAGQLWFPSGKDFVADLERELLAFPNGRFDDQCDVVSMGALYFQRRAGRDEGLVETDEERQARATAEKVTRFQRLLWAGLED